MGRLGVDDVFLEEEGAVAAAGRTRRTKKKKRWKMDEEGGGLRSSALCARGVKERGSNGLIENANHLRTGTVRYNAATLGAFGATGTLPSAVLTVAGWMVVCLASSSACQREEEVVVTCDETRVRGSEGQRGSEMDAAGIRKYGGTRDMHGWMEGLTEGLKEG